MRTRAARASLASRDEVRRFAHEIGVYLERRRESGAREEERAEFVRTMRQQIERLTKLTTDLLDLSQLDAGAVVQQLDVRHHDRDVERHRLCGQRAPDE